MDEKKNHYGIMCLVAVVCLVVGFLFGNVSDKRDGTDDAREQLEQAVDTQREITAESERLAEDAGRIAYTAESVERGLHEARSESQQLGSDLGEAGELIDECQRIIRAVRERGEAN